MLRDPGRSPTVSQATAPPSFLARLRRRLIRSALVTVGKYYAWLHHGHP